MNLRLSTDVKHTRLRNIYTLSELKICTPSSNTRGIVTGTANSLWSSIETFQVVMCSYAAYCILIIRNVDHYGMIETMPLVFLVAALNMGIHRLNTDESSQKKCFA